MIENSTKIKILHKTWFIFNRHILILTSKKTKNISLKSYSDGGLNMLKIKNIG